MNIIQSINNFIDLFVSSFRYFKKGKAWLLLLILFLINWVVLIAHNNYFSPLFYSIITPWLNINEQYAQGFTHYPGHYLLLSYYFGWAKLAIGLLLEGIILGGVAVIFYNESQSEDKSYKSSVSSKLNFWLQLSLTWVIFNGLIVLINLFVPDWFSSILYSPKRQMVFNYLFMPGLFIMIMSILFYSIPYAAIYRVNVFKAVSNSIKMFLGNPITSLFLGFIILFLPIVISIILNSPDIIVEKFKPDLVYWIQLTGLTFDVLVNFFWMGTAVTFIKNRE